AHLLARTRIGVGRLQRVQDRGQGAFEFHVHDGADHLGEAALGSDVCGCVHGTSPYTAAAPAMISISSVVILAWRGRFIWMVRALIRSPALRVALSMAVICEAKKPASFSSRAVSNCTEMFCGKSSCRMVTSSGSYS